MPEWLIHSLQQLYTPARFRVHLAEGLSPPALQNNLKGLRQGCPLSPLLFLAYIDPLLRRLAEHKVNFHPCDRDCSDEAPLAAHGGFADEVGIVTEEDQVQAVLGTFTDFCLDFGLHYHTAKTEILALTPPTRVSSLRTNGIHPTEDSKSWSVTTADRAKHVFQCLPPTAKPLKYLGVYIHWSHEAIQAAIHRDLQSGLDHFRAFGLTSSQRLCIINQVLIPRLVHKLLAYPLLVETRHLEKSLLSFLLADGPDEISTLS
jgi:Reverse transcriptase (RNA-dependent DNA polymerase)